MGSFSTKIHLAVDVLGNALSFILTGGEQNDLHRESLSRLSIFVPMLQLNTNNEVLSGPEVKKIPPDLRGKKTEKMSDAPKFKIFRDLKIILSLKIETPQPDEAKTILASTGEKRSET